jgi:hypothetical protein
VTLAWYDYPTQSGSTGKALINDLNLALVDPNGQV